MDLYSFPYESANGINGIGILPPLFDDLLAFDTGLQMKYDNMTEAEKEHLILKYKDAQNDDERRTIVEALMPEEDSLRAVCRSDDEVMHSNEITMISGTADTVDESIHRRNRNPME